MNETMQAAILDGAKQPFRLVSIPRPIPARGEVLVRVAASGINPLDTKIRAGVAALLKKGMLKTYEGYPHGMPTTHADTINADLLAFFKS